MPNEIETNIQPSLENITLRLQNAGELDKIRVDNVRTINMYYVYTEQPTPRATVVCEDGSQVLLFYGKGETVLLYRPKQQRRNFPALARNTKLGSGEVIPDENTFGLVVSDGKITPCALTRAENAMRQHPDFVRDVRVLANDGAKEEALTLIEGIEVILETGNLKSDGRPITDPSDEVVFRGM